MIIDVHAHYYPSDYMELMGAKGIPHRSVAQLADLDIDQRLEFMDRVGVDVQVLSISSTQPYLEDATAATRAARLVNDRYAEVCKEHPDRLYAFGALPLPDIPASLAEMGRCLDELEMVGVTMGCSVLGRQLDDPSLNPIYEELDRRSGTLFLHPNGELLGDLLDGPARLNIVVGFYLEDTIAAMRLAQAGIPSRYPRMKIIVPHLGGLIPLLEARLLRAAPAMLSELRKMWFDTLNDQTEILSCACGVIGTDHLVWGTDYPYATEAEYEARLHRIGEVGLDPEQVRQIQGDRVAQMLGIGS